MSKRYNKLIVIGKVKKFYYLDGTLQFRVEMGCKYDVLEIEYKGYVEPEKVDTFFKPAVGKTLVFDCFISTSSLGDIRKVYFSSFRELNATKRRCLTAGGLNGHI